MRSSLNKFTKRIWPLRKAQSNFKPEKRNSRIRKLKLLRTRKSSRLFRRNLLRWNRSSTSDLMEIILTGDSKIAHEGPSVFNEVRLRND